MAMGGDDRRYWIQILDRLNASGEIEEILQETLRELCGHFDFGVAFAYEADYRNNLLRTGSYGFYHSKIPETIASDCFSPPEMDEMRLEKAIVCDGEADEEGQTGLTEKLARLFSAKTMIFVPIFDQNNALMACVGVTDRRGKRRQSRYDIEFARAVLTIMGTYIKTRTFRKRVETTRAALDSILNHMGVDVYVNDFYTHEILYLNRSMAMPYGEAEDIVGKICWQVLYDDKTDECDFCPKKKLLDADGSPTKAYGWDYRRPFDGSWFRVLSAAFPWVDGRMAQVISSIDITENKMNEEIIRRMAELDSLTGLPNRRRLEMDIDARIENARDGERGYVLFLDMDGFKEVNDTFGHDVGDELLAAVGRYFQAGPDTKNNSYRYGGDEFVVLCYANTTGKLDRVIDYILGGFSRPWEIGGKQIHCGVSVGISCFPDDAVYAFELLRMADRAMYQSKKDGKGQAHLFNGGDIVRAQPARFAQ
jgi:diguanylate cyclase (GGDEF)-like protein